MYSSKYFSYNAEQIRTNIKEYGVAVFPCFLNEEECNNMSSGMWNFYEHITEGTQIQIDRNDPTSWSNIYKLFPKHSFLQQHFGVGHAQVSWNLRQHEGIAQLFADFWKVPKEELLVSFDGFSLGVPHEVTNKGYYRGRAVFHTDQSFTRNEFECMQSWVTAHDVNEGDATLAFYEGSNKYHAEFGTTFNVTNENDWYIVNEDEKNFFRERGCEEIRITCPKGSLVFWDSRTIHCGIQAYKDRAQPNHRAVIYLCYMPRSLATAEAIEKKKEAFNELRTTSHWPCKPKIFPKNPRTYGKPLPKLNPINPPILNNFGKKLAGFIVQEKISFTNETLRIAIKEYIEQNTTKYGNISDWDVSGVTNMDKLFKNATSFNEDLAGWDVSNVTDMNSMFMGASSFNGDISGWDVSNVTDMSFMFMQSESFNGDISAWDVSNVTDMNSMFLGSEFNGDISGWDVSNVTDMNSMFRDAESFNGDISKWNVSNVTTMFRMFAGADSFDACIEDWDLSKVTDEDYMFLEY